MIAYSKLLCGSALLAAPNAAEPGAAEAFPDLTAAQPSVAWSVTDRCNLNCSYCALDRNGRGYRDELTTDEARGMIEDLATMRVPALLFSGGEPLMRKDTLDLACLAAAKGLHPALATNGTQINRPMAERICAAGVEYAAVSLDGLKMTHNLVRRGSRAFQEAVEGICNCNDAGVKAGVRFTLNAWNYRDLPGVLDLVEEFKIPRFCMYALLYSGQQIASKDPDGAESALVDATAEQHRSAENLLIERAIDWDRRGVHVEIVMTDPLADGAYVHSYVTRAEGADDARRLLEMHGGCSAGCKMLNVDPEGNVRACRFWGRAALGNLRARKFSAIWRKPDHAARRLLELNHR